MSKKKTVHPDKVCCQCLGSGKYQREYNTPTYWHLEKYSAELWRIVGRLKTVNDGESREEIMGLADYSEAVRIVDNHNGEMDEIFRLLGKQWSAFGANDATLRTILESLSKLRSCHIQQTV